MSSPPITIISQIVRDPNRYLDRRRRILSHWLIGSNVEENPLFVNFSDVLTEKIPFLGVRQSRYRLSLKNLWVLFLPPYEVNFYRESIAIHTNLDYSDFPEAVNIENTQNRGVELTFADFLEELNYQMVLYGESHPIKKAFYNENRLHHYTLEGLYPIVDNTYQFFLSLHR